jgi:hypothetical protein
VAGGDGHGGSGFLRGEAHGRQYVTWGGSTGHREESGTRASGAASSPAAAAMEGGGSVGAQRGKWRRLNRGLGGQG